jgi:hypothetical protein
MMARSYERTRAHATISTRNARKKAEMDAEAARLSVQYGLGDCTGSWDLSGFLTRVVLGWFLIVLVALAGISSLEPMPTSEQMTGAAPEILVFLAVGLLLAAIPPRSRRVRLFLFDGGIARVSNLGRRLVVLPWATWTR